MIRTRTLTLLLLLGACFFNLLSAVTCQHVSAQDADSDAAITRYIPDDATMAVVVSPAALLENPMLEMFPLEILRQLVKQNLGIDPADVEEIKIVMARDPAIMQRGLPGSITILRTEMDFPLIREKMRDGKVDEVIQIDGHEAFAFDGPQGTVLAKIDEKTLFIGYASVMPSMLDAENGNGKLPSLIREMPADSQIKIAIVMDQFGPILSQAAMQNANSLAPDLQSLAQIPELTEAIKVEAGLRDDTGRVRITLVGVDEVGAQRIHGILIDSIDAARRLGVAEVTRSFARPSESEAMRGAVNKYASRMAEMIASKLQPTRDGNEISIELAGQADLASVGVLAGMMLPGLQSSRVEARRMSTANNMKQIGLAFHNFHATYDRLPPSAITDKDDKPLLSWRVAILPFMGEQELYGKFHLDEPWDSEHNLPLSKQLPAAYETPNVPTPPGKTIFHAVVGEGIGLRPLKQTGFRDFLDGTSNSILVLEVDLDAAVVWSKPDDLPIDIEKPMEHLGNAERGGFYILLADGAVRFISKNFDIEIFKMLLTRSGGERVPNY